MVIVSNLSQILCSTPGLDTFLPSWKRVNSNNLFTYKYDWFKNNKKFTETVYLFIFSLSKKHIERNTSIWKLYVSVLKKGKTNLNNSITFSKFVEKKVWFEKFQNFLYCSCLLLFSTCINFFFFLTGQITTKTHLELRQDLVENKFPCHFEIPNPSLEKCRHTQHNLRQRHHTHKRRRVEL